jgi:hypothetical protein
MKIDGVKDLVLVPVDLSEFFETPARVLVKRMHPLGMALIRELSMKGLDVKSIEATPAKGDEKAAQKVTALPVAEGSAQRSMDMRDLKLKYGVASHSLMSQGVALPWDKATWDALDEANPAILEKVTAVVDDVNSMGVVREAEEEGDPT